jgi:hypothetical protein
MKKQVGPNVICRIIGSARGPKGSSVGKIVKVIGRSEHPEHVVWGPMWDVKKVDGTPFEVEVTSPDLQTKKIVQNAFAACAEDWLEPLDDDPEPPKVQEKEHELTD